MKASKGGALALALSLAMSLVGCGEAKAPEKPKVDLSSPVAEDTFDALSPILLVVRPQAMRKDPVFGPLVSALSRVAATRGGSGARELEALESAEEVLVSIDRGEVLRAHREGEDLSPQSGIVVLRGVRADLAPEKILDGEGRVLVGQGRPRGRATEHEGLGRDLSLFVLPARTWVVAFGEAVPRSRVVLTSPRHRAAPRLDQAALLVLRLEGRSLVDAVPRLEHGELALGRRLEDLTLILKPGRGGLVLTLAYADEDAALWAESTLARLVVAFSRKLEGPLSWLGTATVVRDGAQVRARVEVPARLVEALRRIDPRELLEPSSPPVSPPPSRPSPAVLP